MHRLLDRIHHCGPITIADFMAEALRFYYDTRDPLGVQGDFTTAPEISQLFGEMLGVWCAYSWEQLGYPENIRLVELGPGRGTLMSDILRATRNVPGFHQALSVHLVETSTTLRAKQQQTLAAYNPHFHDEFSTIPEGDFLLVANEFFDALPIHQYQKTVSGWMERRVGLTLTGDALCFVLTPLPSLLASHLPDAPEGAMIETSPASISVIRSIATRLTQHNGAALVIDYGYTDRRSYSDTLQAMKAHSFHPVLENVGEADITAHVDFTALLEAANEAGCNSRGAVTQGELLQRLGIFERAGQLSQNATPEQRQALLSGLHRLTDKDAMGTLFKAIALTSPHYTNPPGF